MARTTGMMNSYVPDNYPAVADPLLFNIIYQQIKTQGRTVHTGIGLTAEGFYASQGRDLKLFGQSSADETLAYWHKRKILNAEMETAVIFLLASLYQVPAANCLVAHVSRGTEQWVTQQEYQIIHTETAKSVIESIIQLNS